MVHHECHILYHSTRREWQEQSDFETWGAESPFAGRPGYDLAVAAWPNFHRMGYAAAVAKANLPVVGGKARAKKARRGVNGQFLPND